MNQYFPFLEQDNFEYKWFNLNTPRVQTWLHRLDQSPYAQFTLLEFCIRALIHLSGIPYRWFRMIQILLLARQFDLIFLQATILPVFISRILKKRNPFLVFDFDDALYVRYPKQTNTLIESSWRVIAGGHTLYDYASKLNPNTIFVPSPVNANDYSTSPRKSSRLCLGWIGGVNTLRYLEEIVQPLNHLATQGYRFDLLLAGTYGNKKYIPTFENINVIEIERYTHEQIPGLVSRFDLGIMPMPDGPLERGKCALKLIIYMAGARPVVCSPVGENLFVIEEGVNGYFADSPQTWEIRLAELLDSEILRREQGEAGRIKVEDRYDLGVCYQILFNEIFSKLPGADQNGAGE